MLVLKVESFKMQAFIIGQTYKVLYPLMICCRFNGNWQVLTFSTLDMGV